MNILMVSPYLPKPTWGSSTRIYHLLKILARKHKVTLLLDSTQIAIENDIAHLEDLTYSIRIISWSPSRWWRWRQLLNLMCRRSNILNKRILPDMQKAIDDLLACEHYDIIFFESATVAGYHTPQEMKVIIDLNDVQHELIKRIYQHERRWLHKWYYWLEYHLIKPAEIKLCRKATAVLVTSERERLNLKRLLPTSVIEVVPNGVDSDYFSGASQELAATKQIIFTGSMNYYPNVDAVIFFAARCWPLIQAQVSDAVWLIVGKDPTPEIKRLAELPNVQVTGSVLDVRPYFDAAVVAIAPIHTGSGTRLKILEALAMRKAVVSTTLGCEGLSVEPGKHLIVADQPETFAQAVIDFLLSPEMRLKFRTSGRSLVENKYSWEQCGVQILQTLDRMDNTN